MAKHVSTEREHWRWLLMGVARITTRVLLIATGIGLYQTVVHHREWAYFVATMLCLVLAFVAAIGGALADKLLE
jgi:hypothetical protein